MIGRVECLGLWPRGWNRGWGSVEAIPLVALGPGTLAQARAGLR